jgi:hypothetical protein
VQRFALEQRRNAQASFFQQKLLGLVTQLGRIARTGLRFISEELTKLLKDGLPLRVLDRHHPAPAPGKVVNFFFQGHALEQVGDPIGNGQLGVAIGGDAVLDAVLP